MIVRVDKMLGGGRRGGERREMRVAAARPLVEEAETDRLIPPDALAREAVASAESDGIVFIDEIDKIVTSAETRYGADASSEGVQRDLLPIIEGCVVSTKHGNVSTDHMLFIASGEEAGTGAAGRGRVGAAFQKRRPRPRPPPLLGAFHSCKPSDMLAELQGRLPIRVELAGLTAPDFVRILTEPEASMLRQQAALLAADGVDVTFTDDAVTELASVAAAANAALDNIGARRLHTVLERVLDEVSFDAPDRARKAGGRAALTIDAAFVKERMGDLLERQDLSKYVL